MRKLAFLACTVFSLLSVFADTDYKYYIDITKADKHKLQVKLVPPDSLDNEAVFMFPAIVPGTYAIYNFGRFITDFKVMDKSGKEMPFTQTDKNTYKISNAKQIGYITYTVNDTWNSELKKGEIKDDIVFEPAGTDIEAGKNVVINTHGFFGYFKGQVDRNFKIEVKKPKGFYASSGLSSIKSGVDTDVIEVFDYHRLIDSPIMYDMPDTTFIEVGGSRVLVSVYSPNKKITSQYIAKNIYEILQAQKSYLGGTLPVDKYAFLIYLNDKPTKSGANGALEHSYSSMYVLPEIDSAYLGQTMRDVAAHEFFHIVTPLNIHSEEIGNFDFNNPRMSKHLWFYEGLTEYNAHHVQVLNGLIDIDKFIEVIQSKMAEAQTQYNDTMPFTFMSSHVLETKYHGQYNNVYAKGALINMCLDIMLRYYSNGTYGTQNLMADLSKKYGKDKSFKDDELFAEITKLTYPEIGDFLNMYVAGNQKLPFKTIFAMVGLNYDEKFQKDEISLGGFGLGFSPATNRAVIFDTRKMDDFGKKMGYKENDEIVLFNGKQVTMENYKEVLFGFLQNAKVGDKLEVQVARKKRKKEKIKTLSAKVQAVRVTIPNLITVNKEATQKQVIARSAWLGLK
ncbi:MAG: M61 family metallopeptidase [Bacteroidia bacterium]